MGSTEAGTGRERRNRTVAWSETQNLTPSLTTSKCANAKKYLGHVGLFVGLILYTAAGAWVFMMLESSEEIKRKEEMLKTLQDARDTYKEAILSSVSILLENVEEIEQGKYITDQTQNVQQARASFKKTIQANVELLDLSITGNLSVYENVIGSLFDVDLVRFLNETSIENLDDIRDWSYAQSAFFASTVITTIGYGNMAPKTYSGRIFCILFALIGIPFTLTVIADLGKFLASVLSYLYKKCKKHIPISNQSSSRIGKKYGKLATVGGTIVILLLYIAAGGGLFTLLEKWSFFDSFYFSFITMTTIGFGDLVPMDTTYILYIFILYIMVGLALTSTAIELVRIQYADSWRKMRELSTRLQGLSGPLAETLKKYGDNINLDVNVLQDLRELKKVLALNSGKLKHQRDGSIWKKFWENQDGFDMDVVESSEPKLIQITIYESTV